MMYDTVFGQQGYCWLEELKRFLPIRWSSVVKMAPKITIPLKVRKTTFRSRPPLAHVEATPVSCVRSANGACAVISRKLVRQRKANGDALRYVTSAEAGYDDAFEYGVRRLRRFLNDATVARTAAEYADALSV